MAAIQPQRQRPITQLPRLTLLIRALRALLNAPGGGFGREPSPASASSLQAALDQHRRGPMRGPLGTYGIIGIVVVVFLIVLLLRLLGVI